MIFGFDSTAAPGRFTAPITQEELNVFEKSKVKGSSLRVFLNGQLGTSYPGGANKFTCWLNDLRKYKGMDVSDEAKKSCGHFKNIKACDERIKLDCSNLLAGDSDKDDKNASGSMVRCTLPHQGKLRTDLLVEKSKYCKTRENFFNDYYAARTIDDKRSVTKKYNFLLHTPNKFYSGLDGAGLLFPRRDENFRGCYEVPENASGASRRSDLRRVECNDYDAETELNYLY